MALVLSRTCPVPWRRGGSWPWCCHVPVQLPGDERALGPGVALVHGLGREVVVLPGPHHLIRAGVQVVGVMLACSTEQCVKPGDTGSQSSHTEVQVYCQSIGSEKRVQVVKVKVVRQGYR